MPVAKNKVIDFGILLRGFGRKYTQELLVGFKEVFILILLDHIRNTATAREVEPHFYTDIRMQPSEQELVEFRQKYFFQKFLSMVAGAQAIAMSEEKFTAFQFNLLGVVVNGNA